MTPAIRVIVLRHILGYLAPPMLLLSNHFKGKIREWSRRRDLNREPPTFMSLRSASDASSLRHLAIHQLNVAVGPAQENRHRGDTDKRRLNHL